LAATVHEAIDELFSSLRETLDLLQELADSELGEPSAHVCAQGKDVWALITNDIDHERIHAGQVLDARYEARITQGALARLAAEWLRERAGLIGSLVGLTDDQFNQPTAEGGWSYRQVAKHALLVEQDSIKTLREEVAQRAAARTSGQA
jgi:hypothetical protein